MALTKINFYLIVVSVAIIIFGGLAYVGTSLVNSDRINLNEDSLDYLLDLQGRNNESDYTDKLNTNSKDSQTTNVLGSEGDRTVDDTNDFLSAFFIKKERAGEAVNYFTIIYHLPSNLITGIGLDISEWKNYINIISYMLVLAILVMIWTKFINT